MGSVKILKNSFGRLLKSETFQVLYFFFFLCACVFLFYSIYVEQMMVTNG
ncbi:hypothetical protein X975_26187, partial [Stegodyphus mimosarum]